MAGIIGYGVFIPRFRIKVEEIARVWGKDAARVSSGLGIKEKAVAAFDEDSATIAVEASRNAIESSGVNPDDIGAVFVGSESKPYAVKPTATIVGDAVGASPVMTAADFEFACKAGTTGIQTCMGMVDSGMIKVGLAVGSDTAQGRPNDALEFSAGSGGAAFLIGNDKPIALIEDTYSFTTDTPDFWRRQHAEFPRHAGRFTAEPAYFRHVLSAAEGLLKKIGKKANDFDHVVFHQPNGKFPQAAAKKLGVDAEKIKTGLLTPMIGNTYSGAAMVGLAAVLDVAKPNDEVLVVSYGSGAGSDAFSIKVTKEIEKKRSKPSVQELVAEKEYIDYALYVKHRQKLKALGD
ncbi:hydroxymethylglutaryl-CoA synthase [Candidatus Micrarchaeota archaeon]|nr:hydroxymethylglutaryl-CoA synthase [Candidatus Micrarchaeota archaeon]